jgi:hypothetical protein
LPLFIEYGLKGEKNAFNLNETDRKKDLIL